MLPGTRKVLNLHISGFSGIAPDDTRFETDDLHLDRLSTRSDDSGCWLEIAGRCQSGTFHRSLAAPTQLPVLRMHLRGFENFGSHQVACSLGTVTVTAHGSVGDFNALTGSLTIHAAAAPDDLAAWRKEAECLLEHVRRVMSVAAASLLRAPVMEFFVGDVVEVNVWSQTPQGSSALRTIRSLRQEEIFQCRSRVLHRPRDWRAASLLRYRMVRHGRYL